jgi:Ras-related protein Rab-1A
MEPGKYVLKVIIIGEPSVGKTSLVKQFVQKAFQIDYIPTLGTEMYVKNVKVESNDRVYDIRFTIWDIAGQKSWEIMRRTYYRGADGVILVGDLSKTDTIKKIETNWIPDLKQNIDSEVPMILLLNKSDLNPSSDQEFRKIFEKNVNILSILNTSAKTGENVNNAFLDMIKYCLNLEHLKPIQL